MSKITAGFALCGSFCTFTEIIPQIKRLVDNDIEVIPIMSTAAATTDTRFGKAIDFIKKIEETTGNKVLSTIDAVEPIGPKKLLDVIVRKNTHLTKMAEISYFQKVDLSLLEYLPISLIYCIKVGEQWRIMKKLFYRKSYKKRCWNFSLKPLYPKR